MWEDRPLDDPEEYNKLSNQEKESLSNWVKGNIRNYNLNNHTSYGLKHAFEESEGGFYITNGAFKGAMLACGYQVADETAINWKFV